MFGTQGELIAMSVVAAVCCGVAAYHWRQRVLARRAKAMQAASALVAQLGLKKIPEALTDYAEGNYGALDRSLVKLFEIALDPKQVVAEFTAAAWTVIGHLVADPATKAGVVAKFNALVTPAATT